MKIKDGFLLREIVGTNVVIPTGERVIEFNGMITLNDVGAFIWSQLQNECTFNELLTSILDRYDVDADTAKTDLEELLTLIRKNGALEE